VVELLNEDYTHDDADVRKYAEMNRVCITRFKAILYDIFVFIKMLRVRLELGRRR